MDFKEVHLSHRDPDMKKTFIVINAVTKQKHLKKNHEDMTKKEENAATNLNNNQSAGNFLLHTATYMCVVKKLKIEETSTHHLIQAEIMQSNNKINERKTLQPQK
jgi:hypothetical protein